MRTTQQHKKFWANRKINWEQDYLLADGALNHPHRQMILNALARMEWYSLFEVGMGAGANLVRIQHQWPKAQVGGTDINKEAVQVAQKYLPNGRFFGTWSAEDVMLSDNSVDMTLSDACLIYFDPKNIRKAIGEMKRISRNGLVLCEFHHPSWFKRLKLRWQTGYNAYDYHNLLEEMGGYDIQIEKIPKEVWPGTPWEEFGHIITCRFSSRK